MNANQASKNNTKVIKTNCILNEEMKTLQNLPADYEKHMKILSEYDDEMKSLQVQLAQVDAKLDLGFFLYFFRIFLIYVF